MTNEERLKDLRGTIDFLKGREALFTIRQEVDPIFEAAGIIKLLDGGPAVLFKSIKGYPGVRNIANLFARKEVTAAMFDLQGPEQIMRGCHRAMKNPIPPEVVDEAPCQEVVIKEDIDVFSVMPVIQHTEEDAGRILGGLHVLISGDYFDGGSEISFKRMHFQGKDWSSLMAGDHSHTGMIARKFKGRKIPMTLNIGVPPAVTLMAGGGSLHTVIPYGSDELAIAGGLQGFPVGICAAKTVDAYAVAHAEWVIEGYLDLTERVWENPAAEKDGQWRHAPFFPEHGGYMGGAVKTLLFRATAITHRKDRPIFYSPVAHSIEANNLCSAFRTATIFELGERMMPGLMGDVAVLDGQKGQLGAVFQVKKTSQRQEGYQQNIMRAVMSMPEGPQFVIAVDDDIDIHNADDVIWALTTRVNTATGIITSRGDLKRRGNPMEHLADEYGRQGAIGIDATIPYNKKWAFKAGKYHIDGVDLNRFFSDDQLKKIRSMQSEYGRLQARRGS